LEQVVLNIHHDLIVRCQEGDRSSHFKLYKLYAKAMFNVARRITGDEEEAEDVLQEAFISAFKNINTFRGDSTFGAWLKRIVVNKSINALQKKSLITQYLDEDFDLEEEPPKEEAHEWVVHEVREAILKLPDGYRTVLTLYLLEGYDHEEISNILNISESTSKSQLNRAKNKLRLLLKKYE
jgi:RNA polymerase sigma factor (sigma-70 family)